MARKRDREFAAFAEDARGKTRAFGQLRMSVTEVWSYGMKIAVVDRKAKKIWFNDEGRSRTTSMHQGAVSLGFALVLEGKGWQLIRGRLP